MSDEDLIVKALQVLALAYVTFVGYKFTGILPEEKAIRLKIKRAVFFYMVFPIFFFLITSIMAIHQKVILIEHAWLLLFPCLLLAILLPDMWASHKRACADALTKDAAKTSAEVPTADELEDFTNSEPIFDSNKNFDALEFDFDDDLEDAIAKYKARQDRELEALFKEVKIYHVLFSEFVDAVTDLEYKQWVIQRLRRVKAQNAAFDEWIVNAGKAE